MIENTSMVRDYAAETAAPRCTFLRIRSRRVFVVRLWVGMALLHFGFWVMGARAEAAE